jgi:hypothetical protein
MKNILIVNNLKADISGLVISRRDKSPIHIKLNSCIDEIEKSFISRNLKVKIPPFYINSNMRKDVNVIYDKTLDKFYINLYFVKSRDDKSIKKVLLEAISLYINNKIKFNKKLAIKELYHLILTNKCLFKESINGNNLLIPNGNFNGIMIPKIPLNNLHEFSTNITSIYLKNLYPKEIKNENLNKLVKTIKEVFNNINI